MKKSQKGYISPILGEAPTQALHQKLCSSDLLDGITCAKFQNEIFRGYHFTGGGIFRFRIDISMGLTTVQRYCAAYDLLLRKLSREFIVCGRSILHEFQMAILSYTAQCYTITMVGRADTPVYRSMYCACNAPHADVIDLDLIQGQGQDHGASEVPKVVGNCNF